MYYVKTLKTILTVKLLAGLNQIPSIKLFWNGELQGEKPWQQFLSFEKCVPHEISCIFTSIIMVFLLVRNIISITCNETCVHLLHQELLLVVLVFMMIIWLFYGK